MAPGGALGLPSEEEVRLAARALGDGAFQVELSVPGVHCGACINSVEKTLLALDNVRSARVNLSTRRVTIVWRGQDVPPLVSRLAAIGYPPHLFDTAGVSDDQTLPELIRAVAISGFAATNIMLLSVSVWSGADGATRDLFHWVSALIAVPALVFAGRIYYRSAWQALRHGRMNMDVPIAVGISLAYAMSLYETATGGHYAYFDATVSLLFFLLIGRTLDHVMREKARSAVIGLARLQPHGALVVGDGGERTYRPVIEIQTGDRLLIAAGERVPVDGVIETGQSVVDAAITNGESTPLRAAAGVELRAGMLNLTGPLTVIAQRPASQSFLAEMTRLMEAAEGGRARYRRIAERVSALYAPVVHLTALLTFAGWMLWAGDWHQAMTIAIAVLIITCPCALGLAVPIVHVVAARRLFEDGVMLKDGSALERMVDVDTVVFDKTGTLTLGALRLVNAADIAPEYLAVASDLAGHSRHPVAAAIHAVSIPFVERMEEVSEVPGFGLQGRSGTHLWRLGRASWAVANNDDKPGGTVLSRDGEPVARFVFEDTIRPMTRQTIADLIARNIHVEMLSGDNQTACDRVADTVGIERYSANLLPADKVSRLNDLASDGRKVLMVGDGLNDAPALAAARVSMAPATAADIGRNAADFVFLRNGLDAVLHTLDIARRADRLVRQNIVLAIIYNAIAVPIAIFGYVTPLIAAIAMSASSLLVIANALRLSAGRRNRGEATFVQTREVQA